MFERLDKASKQISNSFSQSPIREVMQSKLIFEDAFGDIFDI
jgi:hypothetical protein